MKKQVVILFGPPGAGKGTQGELLSDKLSLYYFETSKILEREFAKAKDLSEDSKERFIEEDGTKYDILEENKLWEQGKLCDPPFVSHLVKKEIKELSERGESLVLAGSPRTLYEGEKIIPVLEDLYGKDNVKALFIEISPKETLFRNSHRRICELMRHPILYSKETKDLTICPLDGSKLLKREGLDDPETIKVRLKEHKERTLPLIDFFKKQGIETKKINGEQSVADVFKDILSALE